MIALNGSIKLYHHQKNSSLIIDRISGILVLVAEVCYASFHGLHCHHSAIFCYQFSALPYSRVVPVVSAAWIRSTDGGGILLSARPTNAPSATSSSMMRETGIAPSNADLSRKRLRKWEKFWRG